MRVRMLSTQPGASSDAGNALRQYLEGGVYDAPGSMPLHVARIFLQAGLAVEDNSPKIKLEIKPAAPPEVQSDPIEPPPGYKPPEQEIDAPVRRKPGRKPKVRR